MRFASVLVAIAALTGIICAGLPQLDATLVGTSISGWNCNPYGGAEHYDVRVLIINPYDQILTVTYAYYDFSASSLISGGRACIISPKESLFCTVSVPVRFGGSRNGTTTIPLRLYGSLEGAAEQRVSYLNLSFSHVATSPEAGIEAAVASAESGIRAAAALPVSSCDGDACCGASSASAPLAQAYALLASARQDLQLCDFATSLREANDAGALARQVSDSFVTARKDCDSALALHRAARANVSRANASIYSSGACGGNVTASRSSLAQAQRLYAESGARIAQDDYRAAQTLLLDSLTRSAMALSLIGDCPGSLQGGNNTVAQKTPATPPPAPGGGTDMISGLFSVLGYIILGAILVVVAAALYVSFGRRWIEGFARPAPIPGIPESGEDEPPGGESTEIAAVGEEQPLIDHEKIDKEFEEWLSQTEARRNARADEPDDEPAEDEPPEEKPEPKPRKRKGRE